MCDEAQCHGRKWGREGGLRERGRDSVSVLVGGQSEAFMAHIFLWMLCEGSQPGGIFFFLYYQCSVFNLGKSLG